MIIDIHSHIGCNYVPREEEEERLIADMKKNGIDKRVVMKNIGPNHPSPDVIKEIASPARMGLAVPFNSESPSPASGPISAVFM